VHAPSYKLIARPHPPIPLPNPPSSSPPLARTQGAKGGDSKKDDGAFDGEGWDPQLIEALERDIVQRDPNVHWYV